MNLWTFGCSFTQCSDYVADDKSWPVRLSNKLKQNLINCGRSGSSNEMILASILEKMNSIEQNDTVIILMTYGSRFTKKKTDRMGGLLANNNDYLYLLKAIGDIDYINNLRTVNTLISLDNLKIPNKFIFTIDSESILKAFNQYNLKKTFFPNFYFWPNIDLKKHITFPDNGHPDEHGNEIISQLIYNQLTTTRTEVKIET